MFDCGPEAMFSTCPDGFGTNFNGKIRRAVWLNGEETLRGRVAGSQAKQNHSVRLLLSTVL